MRKRNVFLPIHLFGLLFLSCGCHVQPSKGSADLAEVRLAIANSNDIYFQAFVKGDSSIFIDRYAKDCCLMPPDHPPMCGENALLEFFRMAYYHLGLRNGQFITTNVYGDGKEFVTEEGIWKSFDARNTLFDNGKFLVLWKRAPEGWKMFRDSFSSDRKK
jgi:ketosteroid isomerase-like protein